MGCVTSHEFSTVGAAASCSFRLSSSSVHRSHGGLGADIEDIDSRHVVSLTSSSYGLLNTDRSFQTGSFLSFHSISKEVQEFDTFTDCNKFAQSAEPQPEYPTNIGDGICIPQPTSDRHEEMTPFLSTTDHSHFVETINTWDLMDGLEDDPRCVEFHANGYGTRIRASKYQPRSPSSASFIDSLRNSKTSFSDSPLLKLEDSRSHSASDGYSIVRSSGLKLLLQPVQSPPRFTSSRTKQAERWPANFSFDSNANCLQKAHESPSTERQCPLQSTEKSKFSDSEVYDPSLIAAFEEALDTTKITSNVVLWQSTDDNSTHSSSSDNSWHSPEMTSDAESGFHRSKQENAPRDIKLLSIKEEDRDAVKVPIHDYEARCPPEGADKVVLYHTSMRGVRKTYEDCCTVRLILRGLGVHVEERDVWMHSHYKDDLRGVLGDILKSVPLVPQLFIKGRYIGGAENVKKLHDEGNLARLMDDLDMSAAHSECDGCGDLRFVLCLTCNGSRKVHNQYGEVSRCPVCNENGLIMCPICSTA